jgi:tetratricopeptide (TPR) repeat protein
MRRILLIVLIFSLTLPAVAQEVPPETTPDLESLVQRAEAAANRAETALAEAEVVSEEAQNAVGLANDMFGLFEAMSGVVGIFVPLLAVVAAAVGFYRLESASNDLREARERFERDIKQREIELDTLRDQLKASARQQRENAAKASLALALLPLGERQYRAQDYSGALDTYRRALELDPDNPIIHYRLGYVYTQSGELDEALDHLNRSLELDISFAPSQAARGYVYRRMGDKMELGVDRDIMYNRAEENFLLALQASPKLMDEDSESWWGSLGGLYRRRGQVQQAIYAYERCADVTPHSSYPFSNLALLYAQTQNRKRMIETYKRVEQLAWGEIQQDVDNYWAYADLIVARLALGKLKETEEVLDTALQTAPSDSPYTLDSLLETLERLSNALEPQERPPVRQVMAYIRQFRDQQRVEAN